MSDWTPEWLDTDGDEEGYGESALSQLMRHQADEKRRLCLELLACLSGVITHDNAADLDG